LARRIRVPLGFLLAAFYIWLARPLWASIVIGGLIAAVGLWLRAVASGHVRKNEELTSTGPYACTRHPLYLGSMIIAVGFAVAARNLWIVVAMVVMFAAIYVPVIRSEEAFLRTRFPEYDDYARRVPRFGICFVNLPSLRGGFSRKLYLRHREYNALLGSVLMLAVLVLKLLLQ
jgi:protein-S-isoprenylcysteine O-methyltransferase Ste14